MAKLKFGGASYTGGTGESKAVATLGINGDDQPGIGVGVIDASFEAILRYLEENGYTRDFNLEKCEIEAIGVGSAAEGQADVTIRHNGDDRTYPGTGTDRDVNIAVIKALFDAFNSALEHVNTED